MRRRLSRGRRGPRRKTEWHYAFGSSDGGPSHISTKSIISHWAVWPVGTWDDSQQSYPGDLVSNPTDLTLVRSLSQFYAWIDGPSTNDPPEPEGDAIWGVGYGLIKFAHPTPSLIDSQIFVSDDQVPGVFSNPTMDWIYRSVYYTKSFGNVSQQYFSADDFKKTESKAMRKLSQNEGVLQTLEFLAFDTGSFNEIARWISWHFESRMLLKEA